MECDKKKLEEKEEEESALELVSNLVFVTLSRSLCSLARTKPFHFWNTFEAPQMRLAWMCHGGGSISWFAGRPLHFEGPVEREK